MRFYDRLTQAVLRRPVELGQYARGDYQQVLAAAGIVCSMSRRGNCWDNAVAESFFATVKVELVHGARWETRAAARGELGAGHARTIPETRDPRNFSAFRAAKTGPTFLHARALRQLPLANACC